MITWHVAHWNAEKLKKNACNLAGNFAITYSGKAITESKVPNSTNIEDMDAGFVSNGAGSWKEENTPEVKAF